MNEDATDMTCEPIFMRADLERAGIAITDVRFQEEIERFAAADRREAPPADGILFVGDSDIRFWTAEGRFAADFAGLPAVNRGFGGARIWETLLYFHRVVEPYRPRVIVYNCGDNDVAAAPDVSARNVEIGFRLFLEAVVDRLPEVTRLFYLAIHPAPCNEVLWDRQAEANARVRSLCAQSSVAVYEDYLHLIFDADGLLRPDIFLPDRLHYAPAFYRDLAAHLRPLIEAVWQ